MGELLRKQVAQYAEAFYGLARLFQDMPCQKKRLSDMELESLFKEVRERACTGCRREKDCWKNQYFQSSRLLYELLVDLEYDGTFSEEVQKMLAQQCEKDQCITQAMQQAYEEARWNLLWTNRMLEQRMAAGEQIYQTANLLKHAASGYEPLPEREQKLWKRLRRELKPYGVELGNVHIFVCENERTEIILTLYSQKRSCISVKTIAEILSECTREKMCPAWNCRAAVGETAADFHFVPDTKYQMFCGIARMTKSGELVSGDNYSFWQKDTGKVIMSLADGMGSGIAACKESERVIELMEQFLEAGFPQETAVRMINSCMLLQNREQMFSTIDLCMVDLYNANCDLIKSGASSTFIKQGSEIEVIRSGSFPSGLLQQSEYESMHRKLKEGSVIIMMTDGVLEALPKQDRERMMAELIGKSESRNAREYARRLMERVYMMQDLQAKDDMTILIGMIWKK